MEEWNTHGMPRKRRENLSKEKVKLLKEWFDEHAHHPYPTEDEKEQLCQKTGVPKEQVSTTSLFSERSY